MGNKRRVTPYWERLPRFLIYPFQPPAIWLVATIAIGQSVTILMLPGFLWLFILLPLLLMAARYGYEALARTAEGYLSPPPTSSEVLMSGYELPVKQFVIVVCGFLAIWAAGAVLGGPLTLVVAVIVYALLPASVIVLAWTEQLGPALNPAMLTQLVMAMRWHYAALFGLLLLIHQMPNYIIGVMPPQLFPFPGIFVVSALQIHFTLVLFHLMGYFLLQFGHRLGIESPGLGSDDDADSEDYSLFERFMDEGNYGAALGEIREIARRQPDDVTVQRRLHRTAQMAGDNKALGDAADQLIANHLAAGREAAAAEIAAETLAQMPDYRPQKGDLFLGVARGLRGRGQGREAVKLCNGFHKAFPDHSDTPELYGLVARIFREDLRQEKQYDAICRFLKQNYPDHPMTVSVTAFHRDGNGSDGKSAPEQRPG